jgi:hypothetical protein
VKNAELMIVFGYIVGLKEKKGLVKRKMMIY